MKKKIFFVFVLLSLISCSKENLEESNDCDQRIDGVFPDESYCSGEPGLLLIDVSGEDFQLSGQTRPSFFYNGLVIKEENILTLGVFQFQVLIDFPVEDGTLEVFSSLVRCLDSFDILCQ